jgi:SPP1 gp7 family putative phage head morphogenesis protein
LYTAYNSKFYNELVNNTSIKTTYEAFGDTAWHERYMLNSYQFSAAKDLSETKAMQALIFQSEGFKDFKEKASEITNIFNDQWLRVEMDSCKRGAVMGENWRQMQDTADLYPYWEYKTEEDDRVRDEHAALEGQIFRIGDPEGDACYPPNDFNCRCHSELVDNQELKESGKEVTKGSDILEKDDPETGKPYVDEQFRFNPGIQGAMPNNSSYSEVLSSANKGNAELLSQESSVINSNDWSKMMESKYKIYFGDPDTLKMTNEEKMVAAYTKQMYKPLNLNLLLKKEDELTLLLEKNLNTALNGFENYEGKVFRGMNFNSEQSELFLNKVKDKTFEFTNFVSTTLDEKIARDFSGKILLEIESKTGKNISIIGKKAEKEILFKSKTKFKYVSHKKIIDGGEEYYHIKMKEL